MTCYRKTRGRLVALLACGLLTSTVGTLAAECVGDGNNDGVISIDEIVRVINDALFGCSERAPDPVQISLSTDKVRYEVGDTLRATLRLYSATPTEWWSEFPLRPELEPCIFNIIISKGHFFEQQVVYDGEEEVFRKSCKFFDGGPARVKGVLEIPPAFELRAEVPLVSNGGEQAGSELEPGIYLVEAVLALGLIPEGGSRFTPPNSPRMRAAVQIEIAG